MYVFLISVSQIMLFTSLLWAANSDDMTAVATAAMPLGAGTAPRPAQLESEVRELVPHHFQPPVAGRGSLNRYAAAATTSKHPHHHTWPQSMLIQPMSGVMERRKTS